MACRVWAVIFRHAQLSRPRWTGWRSLSLVGLALYAFSRAAIFLPGSHGPREIPASILTLTQGSVLTVTGWGVLWSIASVALLLGAFARRVTLPLAAFLAMCSASAAVYLLSWAALFPPDNGEWAAGVMYSGLAVAAFALIKVDQQQYELQRLLGSLAQEGDFS